MVILLFRKEQDEGYYLPLDDAGKNVRDIKGELKGIWDDAPQGLSTRVYVPAIVRAVMGVVNNYSLKDSEEPETEERKSQEKIPVYIIPHFEAGNYGCGFIYYESLATCKKRNLGTKVVFCHVPGWRETEKLERGADMISAVIGAICQQIPNNMSPASQ